jgi:spermidine/putrescine transport system substrate-binding protein
VGRRLRRWPERLALVLLATLLVSCGPQKQQLHIFIWSEYLDPKIVAEFEQRFDCRVTIDLHEDPDSMLAKMQAGGASQYDIVVPGNRTLPIMVKRGLLAPLRHENLPNLTNIAAQFRDPAFDPGNRYGVPYHWGTSGLYVRASKGKAIEDTWGLIFDPARQPGPFLLLEDSRATIGAALRYKGYSLNSTDTNQLAEARALLLEAKRRSLGFEGSAGCKNRVLARGAVLAMTYTEVLGVKEDAETRYLVPREGCELWVDVLSIPAQAPHRDLAEKFINFLLEPRVAARLANGIGSATANQAAIEFIDPADRSNPTLYPPPAVMQRLEYAHDLGEHERLYAELWTQIKSK